MLCKIGEVEVWRILDLHGPYQAADALFPNAGPDVARIIEQYAPGNIEAATGKVILPVQGFLLKTPDVVVLVDACVGNDKTVPRFPDWHHRQDARFMAALTAAGVGVEDVDYVLCTHLHTDHVGWNTQLIDGRWVPTFPNAKYLMPAEDVAHYAANPNETYEESVLPVIAAGQAEEVGEDHALGDFIDLIPTPGHTPGHVSIRVRSAGAEAVITGDALHSSAQCWHPEWHFRYDVDGAAAEVSRRMFLETVAESGARVLGSHFTLPSIGRVRAEGDAFAWDGD